jgi:plasmid stabilization system protein ParE
MNGPIPINIAVEDALTESLLFKLLSTLPNLYATRTIYNRGGNGYLRRNVNGFNLAARGTPFLVGTDLDQYECPPRLIEDWLLEPKHHNLLLRVAVRQAEAWVLADKENFAGFLGIRPSMIREDVESIQDAKRELIQLAAHSRRRALREDICPPLHSTRRVGPNYNARLSAFIHRLWDPSVARQRAASLSRTIDRLVAFRPTWPRPAGA